MTLKSHDLSVKIGSPPPLPWAGPLSFYEVTCFLYIWVREGWTEPAAPCWLEKAPLGSGHSDRCCLSPAPPLGTAGKMELSSEQWPLLLAGAGFPSAWGGEGAELRCGETSWAGS